MYVHSSFICNRPKLETTVFIKKWMDVHSTYKNFSSVQFSLVAQSCLTLCNHMDCSTPGLLVLHQLPELAQTHVHWVGDVIQPSHPLSPSHPLLPLSPPALILSQLRVFSNESILRIRWPKDWSFSFSISPSNEYWGLISFRIDLGV